MTLYLATENGESKDISPLPPDIYDMNSCTLREGENILVVETGTLRYTFRICEDNIVEPHRSFTVPDPVAIAVEEEGYTLRWEDYPFETNEHTRD